jgi:spermidine synthase
MEERDNIWFYEKIANLKLGFVVEDIVYHGYSVYQEIYVLKFKNLGRALILDGCIQLTEKDEFIYHELIVHPAFFTHPCPKEVLVIGGGDGGSVREILKHRLVQQIDLVEIDAKVIEVAKKYLPLVSSGLKDKRVKVYIDDGVAYVKKTSKRYDVVIIDSTDPIGAAKALYGKEFHQNLVKILNKDGMIVLQSQSPFLHKEFIKVVYNDLDGIYPIIRPYVYAILSYLGGMWSFVLGSLNYDPLAVPEEFIKARWQEVQTKYYNPKVHKGVFFMVPQFILK